MIFRNIPLQDAGLVERDTYPDERGSFSCLWSEAEFAENGIVFRTQETNLSSNHSTGTLRGMHYQEHPFGQAKFVSCLRGSIFDVIIDLRSDSGTYCQWYGVELSPANRLCLYVPEGFAHGFLTLEDDTDVLYHMSNVYHPVSAKGVRWNDPLFAIQWPSEVLRINDRDNTYPNYESIGS